MALAASLVPSVSLVLSQLWPSPLRKEVCFRRPTPRYSVSTNHEATFYSGYTVNQHASSRASDASFKSPSEMLSRSVVPATSLAHGSPELGINPHPYCILL